MNFKQFRSHAFRDLCFMRLHRHTIRRNRVSAQQIQLVLTYCNIKKVCTNSIVSKDLEFKQ